MSDEDDPPDDGEGAVEGTDNLSTRESQIDLSMNSVVGLTGPRIMKLRGYIVTRIVTILIDCGATQNFLSQDLVDELQLPVALTSNYRVTMGNGELLGGQ